MSQTIFVLGGDGFCGWPLSLRLSKEGHRVVILDNFSRRHIDLELDSNSLTQIRSLQKRISTWNGMSMSGHPILFEMIDLSKEYRKLCLLIEKYRPSTIVHLAEIKSAPYSMRDPEHANVTIQTNVTITSNVLNAIVGTDATIHLVHLGTMGVYGYGTFGESVVPEGYLEVAFNNIKKEIVHPYNPGSVYHMTKCLDNQMFHTYNRLYNLAITDLHQGIVWGFETVETSSHPDLVNRLDYDSEYGTVLNRLLVQTAFGHPLTVYGTGGQTRAFIHLVNSVDCICLAIYNRDFDLSRVRILNQMTECHCLQDIITMLVGHFGAEVQYIDNPRQEAASNKLSVCNKQFLDLGLTPIYLDRHAISNMIEFIKTQKGDINWEIIKPITYWPLKRDKIMLLK